MQRYAWKNTLNVRDLGYTPTMNGNYIKPQRFIRSDAPHTINDDVKEFLVEHNIITVIDLRNTKIANMNPNAFVSDNRFHCYKFPLSVNAKAILPDYLLSKGISKTEIYKLKGKLLD